MVLIGGHCVRYDEGQVQSKECKHQADEELQVEFFVHGSEENIVTQINFINKLLFNYSA